MKQKKVKKELVLTTYWDYLKHFGREEGRKKWREHKEEKSKGKTINAGRFFEIGEKYAREILAEQKKHKKKMDKIEAEIRGEKENSSYADISGHLFEAPQVEDLEPIQKIVIGGPNQDIRQTKADISGCGASAIEFIQMPIWHKWLKPHIQKDMVDFLMRATMSSGEKRDEAMGGYKYAQKIIRTINKWVNDYTYLMREEEKKSALSATGK